jgi:catechol 2,3-dioxygenase-like lactoylglutathione lyase family enzyme
MNAKGIFYVLAFVSDLERSKTFYRDKIGWKLGTDEHGVAGFAFGTGYLVLHTDRRDAKDRRYEGGMHVEVMVEDAAAEHSRLTKLGVKVTPVIDQPWGERNFNFTDPDGYVWAVGQSMRASG